MSERVWVASWFIDSPESGASFGVVGVATSQEAAEQLLADEMVADFGATALPRGNFADAGEWLAAISETSSPDELPSLADAAVEFIVQEFQLQ